MRRSLASVALLVVAACGRSHFDEHVDSGGSGSGADSGIVDTRCQVPPRPDVSSPRITLGCDPIVASQEVVNGGVIRFDCPTGIQFGAPMLVNKDTIIDGHDVVLDGQGITQIFHVNTNAHLTLLDVTVTRGASNGSGAGIELENGGLVVFDSTFSENHGPQSGPNIAGGAIAALPDLATVEIYGSTFINNSSSNAGALKVFADLTVANTVFENNMATGTGGNAVDGGDGGAIIAAGDGDVTMCGVWLTSNVAGYAGGALFRVSTSMTGVDSFTDVAIDFNQSTGAGAAYIQGSQVTMRRVSSTANVGAAGSGLWLQNLNGLDAENLSIVFNRSDGGTGAGLFLGAVTGRIAFSTIADNAGSCAGCVAAGINGGTNVDLTGTVIVDNTAPMMPTTCSNTGTATGPNFQWPGETPSCAPNATITDPFLLSREYVLAPTGRHLIRRPSSGSPAIGAVTSGCPGDDILGNPRPTPCAAGAVEP